MRQEKHKKELDELEYGFVVVEFPNAGPKSVTLSLSSPEREAAASGRIKNDQFTTPLEIFDVGEPIARSPSAEHELCRHTNEPRRISIMKHRPNCQEKQIRIESR